MIPQVPFTSIILLGNPNTGKTTIFNGLTGLHCHTGNWPGSTVSQTQGSFTMDHHLYLASDLPSPWLSALCSSMAEDKYDLLILTCSAACLEPDLYLLKHLLTPESVKDKNLPIILCINFRDEAEKKGIEIDYKLLEDVLQIPVISCCALYSRSLNQIRQVIKDTAGQHFNYDCLDFCPKQLFKETVRLTHSQHSHSQNITDQITLHPILGTILMFSVLLSLCWLTLACASLPGSLIYSHLMRLEPRILSFITSWNIPPWISFLIVRGFYRSFSWLISMMLLPLTVFLLLFTVLEDAGCLPRIAFHMDSAYRRCMCCTKQCLTTAMGFVCNAAGISQSALMESPRERLIAILTNSFVPCSRQLPVLLYLTTLLFWSESEPAPSINTLQNAAPFPPFASLAPALTLTILILFSITASLFVSWLLSHTLLQGPGSSFTLELPPLRCPIVHKTLLRALREQVLPALSRSMAIMFPTVSAVWLTAYFFPGIFLSFICFLDLPARLMGLNGIILFAFLLAFPAHEMVIPIILTAESFSVPYLSASFGWTHTTMICTMIFCLFHWPCLNAVRCIKKETGSWKWTAVSVLLPTMFGAGLCILFSGVCAALPFLP